MPRLKIDRSEQIKAVETKAEAVRLSPAELCRRAGVNTSTYFRARQTGNISLETLDKLENAIAEKIKERAAA